MGREIKRLSVLDGLKAGEVILADNQAAASEGGGMVGSEPGTGPEAPGNGADAAAAGHDDFDALEPADAFGPDPEPGTGAGDNEPGTGNTDSLGRDASKPRGKASPNYGAKSKAKTNLGFIEKTLGGIHSILAVVSRDDIWELTDDECKTLAQALGNVQDQYNISIDPKMAAWLELAGVGAAIYGPRVAAKVMMSARNAPKEPEPKKKEEPKSKMSGGGMTPTTPLNGSAKGEGPFGAFTPSMMMPLGMAGGSDE